MALVKKAAELPLNSTHSLFLCSNLVLVSFETRTIPDDERAVEKVYLVNMKWRTVNKCLSSPPRGPKDNLSQGDWI